MNRPTLAFAVLLVGYSTWAFAQNPPGTEKSATRPAASQPASAPTSQAGSRPSRTNPPPRGPELSAPVKEIMRELERRGSRPVAPRLPNAAPTERAPFAEGRVFRDTPVRLFRTSDRVEVQILTEEGKSAARNFELLKNSWLEYLEHEMEAGMTEAIINAEVTTYRGRNLLKLWSFRRPVENGNLTP